MLIDVLAELHSILSNEAGFDNKLGHPRSFPDEADEGWIKRGNRVTRDNPNGDVRNLISEIGGAAPEQGYR